MHGGMLQGLLGLSVLHVAVVTSGRQLHRAGESSGLKGFDKLKKPP